MIEQTITLSSFNFPAVQPGTQLAVSDYWKQVDGFWLKIEHPLGAPGGAFRIISVFRRAGETYLMIRSLNSLSPEICEPFIVIRVIDRDTVSTLRTKDHAEAGRSDGRVEVSQWTNLLGEFPDRTSVDSVAVESAMKSMTSEIWLGNDVVLAFSKLKITQRCQGQNQVYFMLAAEGAALAYDFSLQWVGCVSEMNYCLLRYPAHLTSEDPVVPTILLKVINKDTLGVLSAPLDKGLAHDAARASRAKGRVYAPQAEPVFGFIPAD